jgi:hypothetical protein
MIVTTSYTFTTREKELISKLTWLEKRFISLEDLYKDYWSEINAMIENKFMEESGVWIQGVMQYQLTKTGYNQIKQYVHSKP